jgi:hypothetical protein
MFTKRALVSAAAGIALSLSALGLGEWLRSDWASIPDLPGFFFAAFTPGFGVHGDPGAFKILMGIANAVFYGLIAYGIYPIVMLQKTPH